MALTHITLRDFVIVRELELDLNTGFGVLTGETGAGKSILINALQLALGARAETSVVRESVRVYHGYVRQNRLLFLFISSERAGGSRILRLAIREEVRHFVNDMARDMALMPAYRDLPEASLQMVCSLIVNTMLAAAPEILDQPTDESAQEDAATQPFVQQMQLILLGAASWRAR